MRAEAREERLTELARKIWPDLDDVRVYARRSASVTYADTPGNRRLLLAFEPHPRALEALEAALLTLTDDRAMTTTLDTFREAVAEAAKVLAASRAKTSAEIAEIMGEVPPVYAEAQRQRIVALEAKLARLQALADDKNTRITHEMVDAILDGKGKP